MRPVLGPAADLGRVPDLQRSGASSTAPRSPRPSADTSVGWALLCPSHSRGVSVLACSCMSADSASQPPLCCPGGKVGPRVCPWLLPVSIQLRDRAHGPGGLCSLFLVKTSVPPQLCSSPPPFPASQPLARVASGLQALFSGLPEPPLLLPLCLPAQSAQPSSFWVFSGLPPQRPERLSLCPSQA